MSGPEMNWSVRMIGRYAFQQRAQPILPLHTNDGCGNDKEKILDQSHSMNWHSRCKPEAPDLKREHCGNWQDCEIHDPRKCHTFHISIRVQVFFGILTERMGTPSNRLSGLPGAK